METRIDVFKEMLENDPENPMVLFGLANEYIKSDNVDEAVETLEKYLKFETDEGAAYGMLARMYEKQGDADKAKAAFEKGIDVSLLHGHPSMAEDYRATLELDYSE